jgi:hypothetical protein
MRVLVACEESQVVTIAFRNKGHEAYSCDLQECSGGHPEWHILGDAIKEAYSGKYDLMIGHPPCTYLCDAANKHLKNPGRIEKREEAIKFFMLLWNAPIKRICLENPRGCLTKIFRPSDQIIQPFYFGDPERKHTCLWLKNLSPLFFTLINPEGIEPKEWRVRKSGKKAGGRYGIYYHFKHNNSKERSKTFPGIAQAMADQWG